ncbi:MAG: YggU family protein [Methylococcaceae bacterium]|nr:MAG: YggU family protein [Methylococcaceae bacterium]
MSTPAIPAQAAWYTWQGDAVILALRIQPKASRDQIVGVLGQQLKICITAPPVDGKANAHLQAFLAKTFRVAKNQVSVLNGETGRNKRVRIEAPANWQQFLAEITQT